MSHGTHTHWRMTINNYDANDIALVTQGYPDHIRQLIYTYEEGETGTPHIQAYIKMKRDCRLSHMTKLFPRGNFGYCDSLEYKLNQQRYAQKLDGTARSAATIQNGDPLHTVEGTVRRVIERIIRDYETEEDLSKARRWVEREMVVEDYTMAKVFVSAVYKSMWKEFGGEMYQNIFHTHTHTHTEVAVASIPPPVIISQPDDIPDGEEICSGDEGSVGGSGSEGDAEEDYDSTESSSQCGSEASGSTRS